MKEIEGITLPKTSTSVEVRSPYRNNNWIEVSKSLIGVLLLQYQDDESEVGISSQTAGSEEDNLGLNLSAALGNVFSKDGSGVHYFIIF